MSYWKLSIFCAAAILLSATNGTAGGIPASYVAEALAAHPTPPEAHGQFWWQLLKGCKSVQVSKLCRAANVAVNDWTGKGTLTFAEVASFCDAGYLPKARALCWQARHQRSYPAHGGVAETILAPQLAKQWFYPFVNGPQGMLPITYAKTRCARGEFAPTLPLCQAFLIQQRGDRSGTVPYAQVAAFCDMLLFTLDQEPEPCRAAYRFIETAPR